MAERRRKRVLLAGVFALCALAWWLRLAAPERVPEAPRAAEAAPAEGAVAPAELVTPELPVVPEPEPTRVAREPGEPASSRARPAPLTPEEGLLQVRVLALETGRALAGARLRLETPEGLSLARAHLRSACGTPAESLESDAAGRAEFRLAARVPYVLHAQFDRPPGQSARLEIRALEPGQYRTAVVHVFGATDRTWCARVVDGESGLPIPGARAALVRRGSENALEAPLGADGGFCLALAAEVASTLRAWAPGYAEERVRVEPGHGSAQDAQRIELLRQAALLVRVLDARGAPRAGAAVRANPLDPLAAFEVSRAGSWASGTTDSEGGCLLEALPPRSRITLGVESEGRTRVARVDPGLAPGELRELVLVFGSGCTLTGQVLDQQGASLAGLELWLVPGVGTGFLEWSLGEHLLKTRTDEHGRFAFVDVAPGDWRLAPAPRKNALRVEGGGLVSLSRAVDEFSHDDVAPFSRALFVAEGELAQDVVLPAWRGLYIRGHVVGGESGKATHVEARCGELLAIASCRDGHFKLGPLVPGEYELVLGGGLHARPARAAAGSEGVELVLEPR